MSRFTFPDLTDGITASLGDELDSRFDALKTVGDAGLTNAGTWSSVVSYHTNDAVKYSGSWWVSLVDNNVSHTPAEGAYWTAFGSAAVTTADASTTVKGISKLSTAPVSSSNPIAVGDNDSRMTNARTPTAHASTHTNGTDDIQLATDSQKGLLSAADHTSYAAHVAAAAPHSGHLKTDGSNAMAAALDAGGFKVVNLATPTTGTDAVTKTYADALATGISLKASVKVATTANITLSGAQTIDSVSVVAGDRVLVKNQTTGSENGIYVAAAGAWARSTDADSSGEMPAGTSTFVEFGSTHQKQRWTMITPSITLGTTAQEWTQDSSTGSSGSTSANGNSEGVGVWDSLSGTIDYFRGIASTNTFITVALNAGTKSIRLTLNEALLTLNNLLGTLLATKGGTGHSTTTPGDTLTGGAANAWDIVPGNTTTTPMYYRQTGDGVDSAAPEWVEIDPNDLPVMGASGAGHAPGVVGDPGATPGISRYWREDATWGDPVIAAGAGDMAKSVYDTDNDGKVNEAELADAVPWSGVSSKPTTISGYGITDAQALDSDLTAIAGLTPTNDDVVQRKAGAWTNRTPAQLKTDLALVKADVGLGSVTNDAQVKVSDKDATGGVPGLTLFKINFKNAANTFTSFFTNSNTAARTYTFQDRDGTIADDTDLALKAPLASPTFTGTPAAPTASVGTNTTQVATTAFVLANAGSGGATTQIGQVLVTGSVAANIQFASIPATYNHLYLLISGRSDNASGYEVYCRFNGDASGTPGSTGNYDRQFTLSNGTGRSDSDSPAQTSAHVSRVAVSGSISGASGGGHVWIPNYRRTTFHKFAVSQCGLRIGTTINNFYLSSMWNAWKNTAAITQIDLFLSLGNWEIGSIVTLYGVN